jgi:hypothetical protein
MKATKVLKGVTLFVLGMVVVLGIEGNNRHHNVSHHAGVRKSAVIEVGAPLTASQLEHEGFN